MKKAIATIFTLISFFLEMNAQVVDSLNQQVCPKGGVNQLAIKYYGINFTKEQRKEIGNVEIEIIYSIDEFGNPILSEINGISNPHIIDSLKNKTSEIGLFNPQIVDGIPVPSIYFIKLTFPTYSFTQQIPNLFSRKYIPRSKTRRL
ncbi:MAG: hypothetical protein IPL35_16630 [Sphingobacteriales bacterium]|nr:hypothetical protein [Sphingobacteriales bacterium]